MDDVEQRPSSMESLFVRRPVAAPAPAEPAPRVPHRFKVVEVTTRRTLAEDVSVREAVAALKGVRSVVDVNVYVWQQAHERWQPLPMSDRRTLFDLAHRP